jgi:hypothetical protein
MPAGNVIFQIVVRSGARQFAPTFANECVLPFRRVFLSYASEDRIHVLKAAQLLNVLKMKYFQDLLSLTPGDRLPKSRTPTLFCSFGRAMRRSPSGW